MAIASAPGGVFIFGEHGVVYGHPALAAAIDRRTRVWVERRANGTVRIDSKGFGKLSGVIFRSHGGWRIRVREGDAKKLAYVVKAVEFTFGEIGEASGLDVRISSTIPSGSGLSSSSAVSVATVASTAASFGRVLSAEKIIEIAFRAELAVQGFASKTGVGIATHGGYVMVRGGEVEPLNLPRIRLVICDTGKRSSTGEMVRMVARLRENQPDPVEAIFDAIGRVAGMGCEAFRERDFERAGALMDLNQALLGALGVSSPELERLAGAARDAGALGAKLTGAGGGGCMIALCPKKAERSIRAIRRAGGKPRLAEVGVGGLTLE